jgi:hypothetical protein
MFRDESGQIDSSGAKLSLGRYFRDENGYFAFVLCTLLKISRGQASSRCCGSWMGQLDGGFANGSVGGTMYIADGSIMAGVTVNVSPSHG